MVPWISKRHPPIPTAAASAKPRSQASLGLGGHGVRIAGLPDPAVTLVIDPGSADVDGNDLLSYWPALGECEAAPCALQTWGSESRLGLDTSKDAANNNQPDLALTSGDETSLGGVQRQRKGMEPSGFPWGSSG